MITPRSDHTHLTQNPLHPNRQTKHPPPPKNIELFQTERSKRDTSLRMRIFCVSRLLLRKFRNAENGRGQRPTSAHSTTMPVFSPIRVILIIYICDWSIFKVRVVRPNRRSVVKITRTFSKCIETKREHVPKLNLMNFGA